MASPEREQLESAIVGKQKTFRIRIKHKGKIVNGNDYETPTVVAWDESGNSVSPTGAWVAPQTGDDQGVLTVTYLAATLDVAGTWPFNVYLAATGGNVEPITKFHQFEAYAEAP